MGCGPKLLFLGPYEKVLQKGQGTSLSSTEYITVEDKMTGQKRIVKGPCVWFPKPHDQSQKGTGVGLHSTEYIFVEDQLTGKVTMVKGPCVWFPGPYDKSSGKQTAVALQVGEYVRVKDTVSGERWVIKGKDLVFLEPTWMLEGAGPKDAGVKKALV